MRVLLAVLVSVAALAAGAADEPVPIVFRGASDASAAVALDERTIVVADDEDNVLRVYAVGGGPPSSEQDLSAFLDASAEADIEGAARVGDRVYWIGSHGRNPNGKWRPERHRLFATSSLAGSGQPFRGLAAALADDPALQPLELARALGPRDEKLASLAPSHAGLNIEGLCASADGQMLYIGLRNPLARSTPDGPARAIVIPMANPASVVATGAPPRFEAPLLWDLGGLGLRAMVHSAEHRAFFAVAGPPDDGPPFELYRWSGARGDAPVRLRTIAVPGPPWTPEALVAFPGERRLLALGDDGNLGVPVTTAAECDEGELRDDGTCPQKRLRQSDRRSFRGFWLEP